MTEDPGRYVKMSITLPPEQAARIAAAVEAGEAPSASAYIAARLDADAARERTRRWIEELNGGPVDQQARDYWLRQFGVIGEEPGRGQVPA
jgi:Arc/MetJ-type ribon-helix-helix transcriptional regulator